MSMQSLTKTAIKNLFWFIQDIRGYFAFSRKNAYGAFRGKFTNFDEARRSAPRKQKKTLTNLVEKDLYQEFIDKKFSYRILPYEYAMFYHLNNIFYLYPNAKVLDFGGGFGEHFLRYNYHSKQSPIWHVCEIERKTKFGSDIIQRFKTHTLGFINNADNNYDVLITSGVIQYLEHFSDIFSKLLNNNGGGIKYIILQRVPIQQKTATFVSLQNSAYSYSPNWIFNESELLNFFYDLGYVLVDDWIDYYDSLTIIFHRNISPKQYKGYFLQRLH